MQRDFNFVQQNKFCHVDTQAVLKDPEWQDYFQTIMQPFDQYKLALAARRRVQSTMKPSV
jgi:hypothetical protein